MLLSAFILCFFLISKISCEHYYQENFDGDWEKNWHYSEVKDKEFGKFVSSHGKFYHDKEDARGIQTSKDARFYALSTTFPKFSNKDKPLVIQFSVKHEQNIDCGGGYVKLFDCSFKPKELHGDTPYHIMFGPDICGPGTKKVHVILNHNGKNHLINKEIRCKDDVFTNFYTLIIRPDNTYEVLINNEKVESGEIENDWSILPPRKIKDPNQKKPEDWDDRKMIPDPDDKKPEDWDQPETISDPDATKPEDWDEEMDGEWEPPKIDNPEYKGEWKPKDIENPNYSGEWVHPEIDNPEYKPDNELYLKSDICAIGFDLWQVKSGTIFDNILITSDVKAAEEEAEKVKDIHKAEKAMKEEEDKKEAEKEKEESNTLDDKENDDEDAIDEPLATEEHDEL